MLTVKKFAALFNLSYGGYAAAVIGIFLALLTILVFPPDMDLQGKRRWFPQRAREKIIFGAFFR